jgi:hypothetical protein
MFVRSRVAKGRTYYAVVESYRDGAKVRHRQIIALGTSSDVPIAIQATRREIRRLRRRLDELAASYPGGLPDRAVRTRNELARKLALQEAKLRSLVDVRPKLRSRPAAGTEGMRDDTSRRTSPCPSGSRA